MANTVKKNFDVYLDVCHSISTPEFTVVQGDTGVEFTVHFTDSGTPLDLTDCFVQAIFLRSDGTTSMQSTDGFGISIEDAGILKIALFPSSTAPGIVECELQVFSGSDMSTQITSSKFNFHCRKALFTDDTVNSSPELPLLTGLISDVKKTKNLISEAANSALNAAKKADAAADQCCNAIESIPDDCAFPLYKTVGGQTITVYNAQKGGKIQKLILFGKSTVTTANANKAISPDNPAAVSGFVPSEVNFYYDETDHKYSIPDSSLSGIASTAVDEYDIISGTITFKVASQEFNGSEGWTIVTGTDGCPNYFAAPLSTAAKSYSPVICTHFPAVEFDYGESIERDNLVLGCSIMQNEVRIRPTNASFTSLSHFTNTLAEWKHNGTPLTVFYERLNYIYSDNGAVTIVAPGASNFFHLSSKPSTSLRLTYICDMNVFMNSAPLGSVLRRTSHHEMGFEWKALTSSDVAAAPYRHSHGNISSTGAIGTTKNLPVFTAEDGVLSTVTPHTAQELLQVPSVYELNKLRNSMTVINEHIIAPTVNLKNMRDDIGLLDFYFKGTCSIAKPNANAAISPENVAAFTFPKPSKLYLTNNSTSAVKTIGMENSPNLYGIDDTADTYSPITGNYTNFVAKLILTGDEAWSYVSCNAPYFTMELSVFNEAKTPLAKTLCTHFEPVPYITAEPISSNNTITGCSVHNTTLSIRPPANYTFSSLSSWTAFLTEQNAGNTPVTVYYERLIGDIMGGYILDDPPEFTSAHTISTDSNILLDVEYTSNTTQIGKIKSDLIGSVKTIEEAIDGCEYHYGTLTQLIIASDALPSGHYCFSVYFNSGSSISVSLPSSVRWAGGTAPQFLPNKTYELSIKDGLGKLEVYDNA